MHNCLGYTNKKVHDLISFCGRIIKINVLIFSDGIPVTDRSCCKDQRIQRMTTVFTVHDECIVSKKRKG